jgi:hypothetical protein
MNKLTKTFLIAGIILLAYGYLSRMLNIYFFWDSKAFGWICLFIALISRLFELSKAKRIQGKRTVWLTILISFLTLGLLILPFVIFLLKTSDAYFAAVDYLKTDEQIKNEVGNIKGFGLITTGQSQTITINGVESGDALFNLTIEGNKRYKDVTIQLRKTSETDWMVISLK